MGKILNLIEGNMNGDAWEDLCVRCYRMKYQEQSFKNEVSIRTLMNTDHLMNQKSKNWPTYGGLTMLRINRLRVEINTVNGVYGIDIYFNIRHQGNSGNIGVKFIKIVQIANFHNIKTD